MPLERKKPAPPEAERYVLDDQVGYLLRLAGQRHAAIFQSLAPFDLTPTQFSALVRLFESGPCSQNELGRRAAMDVATIKGVTDRLRRKGFVRARVDPDDKRRAMIFIAEERSAILGELHEAGFRISEETLDPLSPEERVVFLRLLRKMG